MDLVMTSKMRFQTNQKIKCLIQSKKKKNIVNDIKAKEVLERIICTYLSTLCHDNFLNEKFTQSP